MNSTVPRLQREIGLGGAATFVVLLTLGYFIFRESTPEAPAADYLSGSNAPSFLVLITFFLLSVLVDREFARAGQTLILFGYGLMILADNGSGSLTGLPIAGIGVILMAQYGHLATHRRAKVSIIVASLLGALLVQAIRKTPVSDLSIVTLDFVYSATAVLGLTVAYFFVIRDATLSVAGRQSALEAAVVSRTEELREQVRLREDAEASAQSSARRAEQLAAERLELLREVHHRAKNSLQMTLTLVENTELHSSEQMTTTVNRIRAIELVYDLVDASTDLSAIVLENYVELLVGHVQMSYIEASVRIRFNRGSSSTITRIEPTISLGLMLHEIVTVIREHSFDADGGTIELTQATSENDVVFVIAHDGASLENRTPLLSNSSAEFGLLPSLVTRLHASTRIDYDAGNRWELTIPKDVLLRSSAPQ